MSKPIPVVAAVVQRDGKFLVTQRQGEGALAWCWEFPGGKCKPGETLRNALRRELREELDVDISVGKKIHMVQHDYPDSRLVLHFYQCQIHGTPRPCLGQAIQWVTQEELKGLKFPPADVKLIEILGTKGL